MTQQKKRLVNWSGAMGISAAHLTQTEDYFIEAVQEGVALHLTDHTYGLLPYGGISATPDDIQIRQHITDRIEIRVVRCNAVMPSGVRIAFNPTDDSEALVKTFTPAEDGRQDVTGWHVCISTDPYVRIPTGTLDPNEEPPRYPDVEPRYVLHVIPEGDLKSASLGGHYLSIGRIRRDGDRYMVAGDYIPPCISMRSHVELMKYYNRLGQIFSDLEAHSKNIIAKVFDRHNESTLAGDIAALCRDMIRYLASVYFGYRNKGMYYAPVDVLTCTAGLAHTVYANLHFLPGPRKEELLKYFYEWEGITPGAIESYLADLLSLEYEHTRIRSAMLCAERAMEMLDELWRNLSRLEYIGQHRASLVVSHEFSDAREPDTAWTVKN